MPLIRSKCGIINNQIFNFMTKTIICRGGLGNQMFQYSFYVMLRHYHRCKFDYSLFNYVKMHNGFELPLIFNLSPKIDEFSKSNIFIIRALDKLSFFPVYRDNNMYNNNILNIQSPVMIGDWQSEKWFESCKDEVLKAFSFKNVNNKNSAEVHQLQQCESVSLHIRRGDYMGNKLYNNCATIEYYINAINFIKELYPNCKFWIFSNDIAWCKSNMVNYIGTKITFVDWNKGADSFLDMYLMSQCKHNIIANSSFSWWGAYLNQSPGKVVIAPKKWMNVPKEQYKDIVPESWIKI